MKALTFLGKYNELRLLLSQNKISMNEMIREIMNYAEEVNRPFKPGMITVLFKDISQEINLEGMLIPLFYSPDWEFYFEFWEQATYSGKCEIETNIPETLDDFIRDCERAGIELEWKVQA